MSSNTVKNLFSSNLQLADVFKGIADPLFTESVFSSPFFSELRTSKEFLSGYPPSNTIATKTGYIIELALAGYNKTDVVVEQEGSTLIISAQKEEEPHSGDYINRGISRKSFTKTFTLSKTAEVTSVTLTDGLLTVIITQTQPEQKKKTFVIE
jgi:molecular chaperone IbpA